MDYTKQDDVFPVIEFFHRCEQRWKDEVIEALKLKVGGLKHTKRLLEDFSRQFLELAVDYQALQAANRL